ncbi:sorbitol dehydrogenase-like [Bacillus rossius redtenbacheri]|uniref:sorbitol dehydrogenase-like n=1 Tax=Bacillus rossius redtenbacheri TaxID=93214 RepID=UPI002FDD5FC4
MNDNKILPYPARLVHPLRRGTTRQHSQHLNRIEKIIGRDIGSPGRPASPAGGRVHITPWESTAASLNMPRSRLARRRMRRRVRVPAHKTAGFGAERTVLLGGIAGTHRCSRWSVAAGCCLLRSERHSRIDLAAAARKSTSRSDPTMAEDNLTAVLYKINDLRLEQRPIPEPKENEVLLQMACVGICGSDVHYLVKGRCADFVVKEPMIMGHEASGIVAKLGKNVKNLKVGDRVAIEPGVPCRYCNFCREGKYSLCRDIFFCATPPDHGNLSRYYVHAADFCYKLPDHVSLEEGALLEPLSVGVHACKRAGVTLGSHVLITGAGPIGLVSLLAAKAMGASKVIITDLVAHRLEFARKLGADYTLQVGLSDDVDELAAKVRDALGQAPDLSVDCTGAESTARLAVKSTKGGGVVAVVGMYSSEFQLPLANMIIKELDIRGCFRYCNDYPSALALVASGKADVKSLITHNYKLEETLEAFETAKTGRGNPIKVMIHCKKG